MRVAFATYPTAFQQPGGGEAVLLALRTHLIEQQVEVDLLDPWHGRLSSYDVLHYFSSIGTDLYPYYRKHLPLVVTPCLWPELPRGVRVARSLSRSLRKVTRRPQVLSYADASVLTPHSRSEAEMLVRNYGVRCDQIEIVPHGHDSRFSAGSRTAFAQKRRLGQYALCVGRIDPIKNQLRLVRALRGVDLDLVLIGVPAAGEEAYFAACQAAAGPRTTFLSPMPSDSQELVDAIAGAACVVIPSIYEIWSLVAHEAGVAGVPIAASSGGSMRELLSPWASFFDPRSETGIRNAVVSAASRGANAAQQRDFLNRPSWTDVASRMVAVYERARSSVEQ